MIRSGVAAAKRFLKTLRHGVERRIRVRRAPASRLFRQRVFGSMVYLRDPRDYVSESFVAWLCRDVYFKAYLPRRNDTVVDIGAGYGHEALYLRRLDLGIRYIAVEVQPSVYECLANTLYPYRPDFYASPTAISGDSALWLTTEEQYEGVKTSDDGPVEVATTSWKAFLERFRIDRISLLKVNIEGGERPLFDYIDDLSMVDRVIVSAHDFRAERGEGEHFRTREAVTRRLQGAGFDVRPLGEEFWWRDWLYGERNAAPL